MIKKSVFFLFLASTCFSYPGQNLHVDPPFSIVSDSITINPSYSIAISSIQISSNSVITGTTIYADGTASVPVGWLDRGTSASGSTYWRGDGTWATVSASGGDNLGNGTGDFGVATTTGSFSGLVVFGSTAVVNSTTFTIVNSTGPFSQYQNSDSTAAIATNSIQLMVGTNQTLCPLDIYSGNMESMLQFQKDGTLNHYARPSQTLNMEDWYNTSANHAGEILADGTFRWYGNAAFPTAGNFYNASVNNGNFYRGDPGGSAQAQGYDLFGSNNRWTGSETFASSVTVTNQTQFDGVVVATGTVQITTNTILGQTTVYADGRMVGVALGVAAHNAGSGATSGTFLRGDNTWVTPTGVGAAVNPSTFSFALTAGVSVGSITFNSIAAPTTPNNGTVWNDSTYQALISSINSTLQNIPTTLFTVKAASNTNTTATRVDWLGANNTVGTIVLPANFWTVGKTVYIVLVGTQSRTGTPTLLPSISLGGTIILSTAAIALGAYTAETPGRGWTLFAELTCYSTGATGRISGTGLLEFVGSIAVHSAYTLKDQGNTINTALPQALQFSTTFGTSNAANSITLMGGHATVHY